MRGGRTTAAWLCVIAMLLAAVAPLGGASLYRTGIGADVDERSQTPISAPHSAPPSPMEEEPMPLDAAPLRGRGVAVWIGDAPSAQIPDGSRDVSAYLLHDTDILYLVNCLWNAGAEAIAVGGVRIGATDGIRCGGPVILVGDAAVAPPVLVLAVGDAEQMLTALSGREGPMARWQDKGMLFSAARSEDIRMPPLKLP